MSNSKEHIKDFAVFTRTMLLLRENNFNYSKTSKDTGVSRQTLRKWIGFSEAIKILKRDPVNSVVNPPNEEIIVDKVQLSKEIFRVKGLLLQRMEELIPSTRNMDTIARSMQILNDLEKSNNENGDIPNIISNGKGFIKTLSLQIYQNTNIVNNNTQNNQLNEKAD